MVSESSFSSVKNYVNNHDGVAMLGRIGGFFFGRNNIITLESNGWFLEDHKWEGETYSEGVDDCLGEYQSL